MHRVPPLRGGRVPPPPGAPRPPPPGAARPPLRPQGVGVERCIFIGNSHTKLLWAGFLSPFFPQLFSRFFRVFFSHFWLRFCALLAQVACRFEAWPRPLAGGPGGLIPHECAGRFAQPPWGSLGSPLTRFLQKIKIIKMEKDIEINAKHEVFPE